MRFRRVAWEAVRGTALIDGRLLSGLHELRPRLVYVRAVSMFDLGDWVEIDIGILGDGSPDDYIVTDLQAATHRRYRNRVTGEVIVDRIRTL